MRQRRVVGMGAVMLVLAACADTGGLSTTGALRNPQTLFKAPAPVGEKVSGATWPQQEWWNSFGDANLHPLVDEALHANPDMDIAQAHLRAAVARADTVDAQRSVQVDAKASAPGLRIPETVLPAPYGGHYATAKWLQLDADYTFDLWGGQRAAWESAVDREHAAQVDAHAAWLSVSSEVVLAYGHLGYAIETHRLLEQDRERINAVMQLVGRLVRAGVEGEEPLRMAEASAASATEKLQQAGHDIDAARMALATLLGRGPDGATALEAPKLIAPALLAPPDDLPAQLIGRRPDIVAARWRVEAAQRDIEVSKSRFYPNINLNAALGLLALQTNQLFTSAARFEQFSPAISLPIFDGGQLRADLAQSDAQFDVAVAQYNKTLLSAFADVADKIERLRSLESRAASEQLALQSASAAWNLSMRRYESGVGSYIEVLQAQQARLAALEAVAQIEEDQFDSSVRLIRALGGGYQDDATVRETTKEAVALEHEEQH